MNESAFERDLRVDTQWDREHHKVSGIKHGKTVTHGMWVDGKIVPEEDEHLYEEEE